MSERAAAVGGTLEIEPTPNGGTTVLAHIPISTPSRIGRSRDAAPPGAGPDAEGLSTVSTDSSGVALSSLRARLQELQQAVAARDEFVATVAHELRNPVAPLMFQLRLAIDKSEQMASTGEPLPVDWVQSAASANRTTSASIARNARPPPGCVTAVNRAYRPPTGVHESRTDGP